MRIVTAGGTTTTPALARITMKTSHRRMTMSLKRIRRPIAVTRLLRTFKTFSIHLSIPCATKTQYYGGGTGL